MGGRKMASITRDQNQSECLTSCVRCLVNPDLSFEPDHPSELGALNLLQILAAQHLKSWTISETVGNQLID
jgi:hypothetical protein